MGETKTLSKINLDANAVISAAAQLPLVHVDREKFLRAQFDKHCDEQMLDLVVKLGPLQAGVSRRVINQVAKHVIRFETTEVTLFSAASGVPGALAAMLGAAAADMANFQTALLRVAQKLAYIHGWPELFQEKGKNLDEETKGILMLFVGVMYGIATASKGIEKLAGLMAANVAKTLQAKALTKTLIYPIVKKVSLAVGARMTKQIFASGVSKIVPVLGAVISGGISLASFPPMARRLNTHLAKMQSSKQRAIKRAASNS